MSLHLSAAQGEYATRVLMPGDPLRAKFIAENYFQDSRCVNEVRGMLGYTGTYKGQPISVQGSGMGMPSMAIYATELIKDYNADTLIRVGTCGAFAADIKLGEVIICMAASSDSGMNKLSFGNGEFAAHADAELFVKAVNIARENKLSYRAGGVVSTDAFYAPHHELEKQWQAHGVMATDMETAILYSIALKHKVRALSILTVSDNLITDEHASQEDRRSSFTQMMELALAVVS